ncbi:two-component sensor histidine kinase [Ammoniphilus oxalaticus]|uniref:histidine kinase n=1 Tax=Ammoniphilus oxalaticus TaxID=66863 RepID=A0A419SLY6_9BACL|nr:HAMP domain-containing sensor histidine kinase [Ammoniphilus oxalaticus]RKD25079.1 two-component sensor histidine kinase [Ammoniphilus oxalaticus]
MKWFNKTLFRRILISFLVTLLIGLGVVGFSISWLTKDYMYTQTQEELVRKAKRVNATIQRHENIDEKTIEMLALLDQSFDTRIWVFDKEGQIIATSMKDEVFIGKSVAPRIVDRALKGQDVLSELHFEGLNKPMISVVVPWGAKKNIYGGIVLHAPVEGLNQTFVFIRETILWAILFGVILSTAIVSYLSWSITRPLHYIERTAMEIEQGNYHQRLEIDNPAELADLAKTVNRLAEKVEKDEMNLKREEKIRNDFLANISHDLRTPLTAIQGFLEALQDGLIREEETRQHYYQVMYQETMHLNRLVEDLMDLIKLENKDITLFKTPVDIVDLLEKLMFAFQPEADAKETQLEITAEAGLPMVYADRDRVAQIFKNLLQNAVKFTSKGHVQALVLREEQYLKINIKDTGIGIETGDLERIWERFFKGDRVRSKANKGTGLGLSIVQQLVKLHHGKISVHSELGKGTTFTVWLPIIAEYGDDLENVDDIY